jgi:ectoine hydroxylase-related dioxygenase (phytanoyl-CoA dioxygenase family)
MDPRCLEHRLSDAERSQFDEQGYLIVENALAPERVAALVPACDRLAAQRRKDYDLAPHDAIDIPDIIGRDPLFLELIDCETTFPKAWGILGWNSCIYHSGLLVTPPDDPNRATSEASVAWHQDSMRVNDEIEVNPRPRLSIKVFFFVSDMSKPGRGNTLIVPGSHLRDEVTVPEDGHASPEGAIPLCVPAGAAVIIDRRIWHSRSINDWHETRKMLMLGYSFRWLLPKDNMTVEHLYPGLDPIRGQLLRDNPSNGSTYAPEQGDTPLRDWLSQHCPQEAEWAPGRRRQSYRPDIPSAKATR